jgi:hypothetical protein
VTLNTNFLGRRANRAIFSDKTLFEKALGSTTHAWSASFLQLAHENDHALAAALCQQSGIIYCNDVDIVAAAVLAAHRQARPGAVFRMTKSMHGHCFVSNTSSDEIVRRFETALATVEEVSSRVVHDLATALTERKNHNAVNKKNC